MITIGWLSIITIIHDDTTCAEGTIESTTTVIFQDHHIVSGISVVAFVVYRYRTVAAYREREQQLLQIWTMILVVAVYQSNRGFPLAVRALSLF